MPLILDFTHYSANWTCTPKKETGNLYSGPYIHIIVVYIKRNEFQRPRDPAEDLEVDAHQSVFLAELLQ